MSSGRKTKTFFFRERQRCHGKEISDKRKQMSLMKSFSSSWNFKVRHCILVLFLKALRSLCILNINDWRVCTVCSTFTQHIWLSVCPDKYHAFPPSDTHTCLQIVHTNPHAAATLLFPACGYSQTESEWHHKPVCPFYAKPDVSLSHMQRNWSPAYSSNSLLALTALSTSLSLSLPSPPSVITYKSYWQLEAHLARSGSHSNQSVPNTLNNLPLASLLILLHTFIIHHHDSFLCLWTAPSVISASLGLPPQYIWQPTPCDAVNE